MAIEYPDGRGTRGKHFGPTSAGRCIRAGAALGSITKSAGRVIPVEVSLSQRLGAAPWFFWRSRLGSSYLEASESPVPITKPRFPLLAGLARGVIVDPLQYFLVCGSV